VLHTLTERGYVRSLGRRPGQKEDRFEHLFGSDAAPAAPATSAASHAALAAPAPEPRHEYAASPPQQSVAADVDLAARVSALEDEVAALRADLEALRQVGSASPTR
jgi:uncharacterized protein